MVTNDTQSALEAIQFFANSANSVQVFEALAEGVTTSSTLAERTGASRSTVARILDEGEARGWIDSEGSRYELTYMGEIMIERFRAYQQTVQVVQHLGEAVNYLREPAQELEISHFHDAEITVTSADWPNASYNRALELYETSDMYRSLSHVAPHILVQKLADLVHEGQLEFEGVIEAKFIEDSLNDPELAAPWYEFADRVRVYEGRVPINMHIIDETVVLWLDSVDGDEWEHYGLLESEHPSVMTWAESLYREYWEEAEPLDASVLPEA